jgi:hypothetical protein
MAERLSVRDVSYYMRNVRTRMPFRYGVASLTSVPILHVLVDVELADGTPATGVAADILPPKWFDKDPAKSYADNIDDLVFAAHAAATAYAAASTTARSVFDIWRDGYTETLAAGDGRGLNHLTSSHGSTLMERALIDALGKARGCTYHQMLTAADNPLGLDLGAILPSLAGVSPAAAVAHTPQATMAIRHTVGLADPIRDNDIPLQERLDDGLPQSLQAYLRQQGLRWLKVKVNGDFHADVERLKEIAAIVDEVAAAGAISISLDGNEQYGELHSFGELLRRVKTEIPAFYQMIRYIEQPLERAVALDASQAGGIAEVCAQKPMLIDESDGDLDAFTRAIELGYRGVSTKNCKGLFKALANAALARRLTAEADGGDVFFLTGEDLMNLPIVPLHQDLTHVAALGIEHVERNGHHYVHGIDHLSPAERQQLLADHADMYHADGDTGFLRISNGTIDIRSLQRPGLGTGDNVDTEEMVPLQDWTFDSLA